KAEGLPRAEVDALLEAGMKIDPTYNEMYKEMAVYLLPRWNGEPGDVERFAADIVKRLPGDDGLDAYGHIAYIINQFDCFGESSVFWGGFDRERLAKAAEIMVKRYPKAPNLVPFSALCAMAAQDHEVAKR